MVSGSVTHKMSLRKDGTAVKVFDFDNTIYKGESSIDFSFYMIRHNKKILRYVPKILISLAGYKLCLLKKEKLESIINDFLFGVLDGTESITAYIGQFWESHAHKLNQAILHLVEPEDVILSASPIILIRGIRCGVPCALLFGKVVTDLRVPHVHGHGDQPLVRHLNEAERGHVILARFPCSDGQGVVHE